MKIKLSILFLIIGVVFVLGNILPVFAADSSLENKTTKALNTAAGGSGFSTAKPATVESVIGLAMRSILSFLGIIFMILVVYAGFMWMTARGEEAKIEESRTLLINAVVGLLIVIGAYVITGYIVGTVTYITTVK